MGSEMCIRDRFSSFATVDVSVSFSGDDEGDMVCSLQSIVESGFALVVLWVLLLVVKEHAHDEWLTAVSTSIYFCNPSAGKLGWR